MAIIMLMKGIFNLENKDEVLNKFNIGECSSEQMNRYCKDDSFFPSPYYQHYEKESCKCPDKKWDSPKDPCKCQDEKWDYEKESCKCPDKKWDSPKDPCKCQDEKWDSPKDPCKCPYEKWNCPKDSCKCQDEKWNCPKDPHKCPDKKWDCPKDPHKCQDEKWDCPKDPHKCQDEKWDSPKDPCKCQDEKWDCPKDPHKCPDKKWDCPKDPHKCPDKKWDCQKNPCKCPKISCDCPPTIELVKNPSFEVACPIGGACNVFANWVGTNISADTLTPLTGAVDALLGIDPNAGASLTQTIMGLTDCCPYKFSFSVNTENNDDGVFAATAVWLPSNTSALDNTINPITITGNASGDNYVFIQRITNIAPVGTNGLVITFTKMGTGSVLIDDVSLYR